MVSFDDTGVCAAEGGEKEMLSIKKLLTRPPIKVGRILEAIILQIVGKFPPGRIVCTKQNVHITDDADKFFISGRAYQNLGIFIIPNYW